MLLHNPVITGSLTISGSLLTTGGTLEVTSSHAISASYAISASHEIIKEVSSSHADTADTASYVAGANVDGTVANATTASYVAGANVDGTVANATTASYALTASYAENAGGGGGGFPYTGSAIISGSLQTSGSVGFSYGISNVAAWSAGGAMITGRAFLAGAGTQDAGLAIGGTPSQSNTEEYDGSSWSAGGALINNRLTAAAAGTQDAGLTFGGLGPISCTEEYDGSSWSAGGALSTGRYELAGAGTQNAGLAVSGYAGTFPLSCTEEYNGSSWATGGALILGRQRLAGAGTQNAGVVFGGYNSFAPPPASFPYSLSCTEEYNGTSWSSGGALITARMMLGGAGTQNAGLAFGGYTPTLLSCTEEYDGSSWTTGVALITARGRLAGAGTQNLSLAFGGGTPSTVSCTEEYTGASTTYTKTFDYDSSTGTTTVSSLVETSAERYKDNIQPMGSQLNKLMQLQPVEFDWKSNKKHDIGFVADSVKSIYPNLVSENAKGEVEGMNYSKLVSALVKSVQEQQTQINELKATIENLKQS